MLSTFLRRRIGLLLLGWLLLASWLPSIWSPVTRAAGGDHVFLPLVLRWEPPPPTSTPTATPTRTPEPPAGWSVYERRVVELTNQERANNGCSVMLAMNDKLHQAASSHSADMIARDFFSHTNPDGQGLSERLAEVGYNWWTWGENIAAGYASPEAVMSGWMNSPGHRANILNCNYTEIGVGYAYVANDPGTVQYRHYWTQVFAKPR